MSGSPSTAGVSTALLTDQYELTMLAAALADGTADAAVRVRGVRPAAARRPPVRRGRRHRPAAGGDQPVPVRRRTSSARAGRGRSTAATARLARRLPVHRRRRRLPRGRAVLPRLADPDGHAARSPRPCVLETLVLSILNHDCAVASAAARMVAAAAGRPLHRDGLAAHPRGGRGRRGPGGVPRRLRGHVEPGGRPALRHPDRGHRRARLHAAARRRAGRVPRAGRRRSARRPRCWSTPTTSARASSTAVDVGRAGARRRSASTPATSAMLARQAREQLDELGATGTRIVVSGDLDEYAIAALRAEPVDAYGVGTSVVTGSGAPTAGMVYKLVEVDGRPVAKRSAAKESRGGRKSAVRRYKPTGTAIEEVVHAPADAARGRPARPRRAGAAGARRRAGAPACRDAGAVPRAPARGAGLAAVGGARSCRAASRRSLRVAVATTT